MSRRYSGLSLSRQGTAHTVLLRMAEDQDRAARIAELKKCHPRLTWAKIAEETGVKERSAIKWQKTGALKPENAEALARLFGVDFDYIWTGPRPETPDMFVDRRNRPAGPIAVNRVEGDLAEWLASIEDRLNTVAAAEPSQLAERLEDAIELRPSRSRSTSIRGSVMLRPFSSLLAFQSSPPRRVPELAVRGGILERYWTPPSRRSGRPVRSVIVRFAGLAGDSHGQFREPGSLWRYWL
jgi:hypothetical protein